MTPIPHLPTRGTPASPCPLDGYWTGYRDEPAGERRLPVRLVLRFSAGLVVGSGDWPGGTFDVFGLYGPHSRRVALLATGADGSAADFDGTTRGDAIAGTWLDDTGRAGGFTIWPVERMPGVPAELPPAPPTRE
jgi:hypothetical protein